MPNKTIKEILIERDGLTEFEANDLINDAKFDFEERLWNPDEFGDPYDICRDWFDLEPDWLDEFF